MHCVKHCPEPWNPNHSSETPSSTHKPTCWGPTRCSSAPAQARRSSSLSTCRRTRCMAMCLGKVQSRTPPWSPRTRTPAPRRPPSSSARCHAMPESPLLPHAFQTRGLLVANWLRLSERVPAVVAEMLGWRCRDASGFSSGSLVVLPRCFRVQFRVQGLGSRVSGGLAEMLCISQSTQDENSEERREGGKEGLVHTRSREPDKQCFDRERFWC